MLGFILKDNLFREEEFRWVFKNSDINFWIIILVLILFLIINIVEFRYKIRINLLLIRLFYLIRLRRLVNFFLLYEIVFVLIIFAIIVLGYRYERLIARFIIIFYSFIFSRPVLIMILLFDNVFLIKEWLNYRILLRYFFVGSFIVKFPIFGFHYWLPVAHVEASTVGSILLAGVLLKLGSVGLVYVIMYLKFIVKFHWLALRVRLTMLIILRLRDLKIMIAYSSVAHISIVFYILILGYRVGKKGRVYIIFYHGFISPLIFWVVGMLAWWKTRSLLVVKMISFSYIFLLVLFLLFIINISFPPFIGFIREILILKVLVLNYWVLGVIIIAILFRCYYNVYLFWCFNGFLGRVYKINLYNFDLFIFLGFVIFINLY